MVLWYAAQRFCWEFFKPYTPVLGPLNLFHLVCLGLIGYAAIMLAASRRLRQPPRPGESVTVARA